MPIDWTDGAESRRSSSYPHVWLPPPNYHSKPVDKNSAWYKWGRWLFMGIMIGVPVLLFLWIVGYTYYRARQGKRAITGTQWLLPPSYRVSQQQYNNQQSLPPYDAENGHAGAQEEGQLSAVSSAVKPGNKESSTGKSEGTEAAKQYNGNDQTIPGSSLSYPQEEDLQAPAVAKVKN